ncbi:MAG: TIGR02452 family protein [Lachnospiraceae bacterium]|nr:TIGR02452 family protein [Lachnospiraceae bacterium]
MAYVNEKENRAQQAVSHTEEMEKIYGNEIKESVRDTTIYDVDFVCMGDSGSDKEWRKITLEPLDSVSAIIKAAEDGSRMAVLNFSSYRNPGGGFIGGSRAQEECLCHESFLYNVLSQKREFYDWNNQHKNRSLYCNRGMYTPGVIFMRGDKQVSCDVITCAAPNFSAASKNQVSPKENSKALKDRIRFILDIARENRVNTLILGAYGCGVFGQDPREVADIFKEYLETEYKCFEKVIFAIPKGKDGNCQAFAEVWDFDV